MERIKLTQGKWALVDAVDFEHLNGIPWHVSRCGRNQEFIYAEHTFRVDGESKKVSMHRLIKNAKKGEDVDHRDNNGLHNWRGNLRKATRQQNQQNRHGANSNSKSGIRGVFWCTTWNRWIASVDIDGRRHYAGKHTSKKAAALAVRELRKKLFGSFAGS